MLDGPYALPQRSVGIAVILGDPFLALLVNCTPPPSCSSTQEKMIVVDSGRPLVCHLARYLVIVPNALSVGNARQRADGQQAGNGEYLVHCPRSLGME